MKGDTAADRRSDVQILEMAATFRRAHAIVHEHARGALRGTGLTLTSYRVLLDIGIAGSDGLSIESLATNIGLHRTSVRATLESLAQRRLVDCSGHTTDRRCMSITLTERGRAMMGEGSRLLAGADRVGLFHQLDDIGAGDLWTSNPSRPRRNGSSSG